MRRWCLCGSGSESRSERRDQECSVLEIVLESSRISSGVASRSSLRRSRTSATADGVHGLACGETKRSQSFHDFICCLELGGIEEHPALSEMSFSSLSDGLAIHFRFSHCSLRLEVHEPLTLLSRVLRCHGRRIKIPSSLMQRAGRISSSWSPVLASWQALIRSDVGDSLPLFSCSLALRGGLQQSEFLPRCPSSGFEIESLGTAPCWVPESVCLCSQPVLEPTTFDGRSDPSIECIKAPKTSVAFAPENFASSKVFFATPRSRALTVVAVVLCAPGFER